MGFVNERTQLKYQEENKLDEFNEEYEKGLKKVEEKLNREYPILIGNQEIHESSKFEVKSPIDEKTVIGKFNLASETTVSKAIQIAKEGFYEWRDIDWKTRVEITMRAAELMQREKFELAATIAYENGKTRAEAVAEVDETIDYFRYYAKLLQENRGYVKEMDARMYKNEIATSVMRPYGVWLIIAPFNFPLAITSTMTLGAVITGNTAIVKPSSDTPLSAYNLVTIMRRAGFPQNVVNYVTGSGSTIAKVALSSKDVSGLAFTGSRDVGHSLLKELTSINPRPVVMELGGKNPVIVTSKANLDKAVEGVTRGAFGFGGQKCSATSRVYVYDKVYETFIEKLVERVKKIKVGDPRERDTFLGPIINREAVKKYTNFIEEAKRDGGKIAYGGKALHDLYVEPTVVTDLPLTSRLWKTELFVPILLVTKYDTLERAIRLANDVDYGLTAGIFSEDKEEIEYFFSNIESGVAYANREVGATTGAMPGVQPFGGWKHSGYTGKNAGGQYYLLSFMREQARTIYT
ncbi:1-pyrroline-5-carboxylate dehydrogenase [Sulfolobales archaeon HS-7]|nr:1-pyrroline-5-carboxylate dehydrogenase [Sulfolobales archaeon HS-7]